MGHSNLAFMYSDLWTLCIVQCTVYRVHVIYHGIQINTLCTNTMLI